MCPRVAGAGLREAFATFLAMRPLSILLVEDDERLGTFTAAFLVSQGAQVIVETDGRAALERLRHANFDAIVLDLMLPLVDGLAVCRSIRQRSAVPILMVSARRAEEDRLDAFASGADDFVVKPFSPLELLARVSAVVRRDRREVGPSESALVVGELSMSPRQRSATYAGRDLDLRDAEFDLLLAFARNPGRTLARSELMRLAHGSDAEVFDRAIDVQVSRLRAKLGASRDESPIRTVRGVGYLFVP
jgi:DNA-binding response OmpR family regulator